MSWDGKHTFDTVLQNVNKFRNNHPNYVKLSISACYDLKTDLIAVKEFFEKEKLFVAKFSPIEPVNTNYYNSFTPDDYQMYSKRSKQLKNELLEYALKNQLTIDKFVYQALGVAYLEFSFHCMIGDSKNRLIPYTGTCLPGEKLYITHDNNIHMCEKINPNFSIGDVEHGLDYNNMADMINEYNKNVTANCIECDVTKLCTHCFAKFSQKDKFAYNELLCENLKHRVRETLIDFVNVLEEAPELVDKLTVNYYDYIMRAVKGEC